MMAHMWSFFSSQNSDNAACDVCVRTVRYCGNITNLVKDLRLNHKREYDEVVQPEEGEKGAARVKQTSITESVRHRERRWLFIPVANGGEVVHIWL